MKYKITIANLKKAVNESVQQKANEYKNLIFVNNILKEYPEFNSTAKQIIKTKRDKGRTLYNYLLNECGCASKYNALAEYVDYANEDELLYDEPMKEYSDDPSQDYDMERDESERWDHFNEFNEGDDVIVFITPSFKTLGKIIKAGDETSLVQYNNDIHDTPNNQLQLINSEDDLEDMPWHIVDSYKKSKGLTETLNEMTIKQYNTAGYHQRLWGHPDLDKGDIVLVSVEYRNFLGIIVGKGNSYEDSYYVNIIGHDEYTAPIYISDEYLIPINSIDDFEKLSKHVSIPQYVINDYKNHSNIKENTQMPKYWVAEKDGKKRFTECSSLNEDTVKGEIQSMEKEGYKMTAFKNEADMKKYLSGSL